MRRLAAFLILATFPALAGCGLPQPAGLPAGPPGAGARSRAPLVRPLPATSPPPSAAPGASPHAPGGLVRIAPRADTVVFETEGGLVRSRPDGSQAQTITTGRAADRLPSWSKEGARLAFFRAQGAGGSVMTLDLATGGLKPLVNVAAPVAAIAWLPGGRSLVYASADAILRAEEGARPPRHLLDAEGVRDLAVSPDGQTLVFSRRGRNGTELARVAIAGGKAERLPVEAPAPHAPAWSPSGRSLAFASDQGVHVALADGSGAFLVAPGGATAPAWDPAGGALWVVTAGRLQRVSLPAK